MSENLLQTLQQLVQDVIAPDVRELKVRLSSLEKLIEVRFEALDVRFDAAGRRFTSLEQRFDSFDQKADMRFNAMMSALGESKAQAELSNMRVIAALSERVAVLESQRH